MQGVATTVRQRSRPLTGQTLVVVLATFVGLAGGLAAALFIHLIRLVRSAGAALPAGDAMAVAYAVAGGLLVGMMVHFLAREARGTGVSEVIYAVARLGGRIRPRVAAVKTVATAITIGVGGSAGREGPIVQIGAALGSAIGQVCRLPEERLRTLVACGAAAGISATFNAPIAGSLFALEVILGDFGANTFMPVVISSVTAAVVSHALIADGPLFKVPPYELVSPAELLFYAALGVVAMVVSQIYIRVLCRLDDHFDRLRFPEWAKPALGAVAFSLTGLVLPQTLGTGEGVLGFLGPGAGAGAGGGAGAGAGAGTALVFAGLALAKIFTTSITIGSGGSGGVFSPGLFIGGMTGAAVGTLANALAPAITASPVAYALVGMAAVSAGVTQAPLTAILMLFEMTQDYRIILPLMLACVVASGLSALVSRETIYTFKLLRHGVQIRAGRDANILRSISVAEVMSREVEVIPDTATLGDVVAAMQSSKHTGYPVVGPDSRLAGIITLHDIRSSDSANRLQRKVGEVMSKRLLTVHPSTTLEDALALFIEYDVGRLPVVTEGDPGRLVGILTRKDITRAYGRALLHHEHVPAPERAAGP